MSTTPVLKNFEITYVMPANFAGETGPSKSLNFHRFMRHVRDCHRQLLEFISNENLLPETGASTLVADERKTVIEASEAILRKIRILPFVESVEEIQARPRHAALGVSAPARG